MARRKERRDDELVRWVAGVAGDAMKMKAGVLLEVKLRSDE